MVATAATMAPAPAEKQNKTHAELMARKAKMSTTFRGQKLLGGCPMGGGSRRSASRRKDRYCTAKDPRFKTGPSFTMGGKFGDELDTLASCSPFFQGGTHRCPQGEELLDQLRRRDDEHINELHKLGRQWKATPGPGTYRTPRDMGKVDRTREVSLGQIQMKNVGPSTIDFRSKRPVLYKTLGGLGHTADHEGPIPRYPTPRNITPGPGHYFQGCSSAPTIFSDFHKPQGDPALIG